VNLPDLLTSKEAKAMRWVLLLTLTGSWLAQGQAPAAGKAYLLRGGTIHTISGPVIENGSILIRDGKIVGVGKDLPAAEGVTVVDVTGRQVYPGMIDSGSMVGLDEIDSVEASNDVNEAGLLNPQLRALTAVNPSSEHIEATRANGVTSVIAMPDGDLISGQMALIHLDGGTNDEMAVLPSAAIHLKFPAIETTPIPPHEVSDDEDPKTAVEEQPIPFEEAKAKYLARMDELNTFFDDARRYWRAKQAGIRAMAENRKFEAMIPVFEGKTPMFVTAVRAQTIREAIEFADKQKIRIILADPYEAYQVLDLIKAHDIPVVLGPTNTLPLNRDDDYDRSFTTPGELFKAGIKFSIATFSTSRSRNLPYEAAAAVPFGLPHDEAYKAISLNAAEIFGVSKRLGSIDEGKTADLIITDGDPMEARTQIKSVFIDGKPVDLETRQKKLYEKYLGRK
jgi:imidazolonepropionase-like amidohydrolase